MNEPNNVVLRYPMASPSTTPAQKKSMYPLRPVEARTASLSKRLMRSGITPNERKRSDQNC